MPPFNRVAKRILAVRKAGRPAHPESGVRNGLTKRAAKIPRCRPFPIFLTGSKARWLGKMSCTRFIRVFHSELTSRPAEFMTPQRQVPPERKTIYYVGMAVGVIGFLSAIYYV
jgi:hypothetical protein